MALPSSPPILVAEDDPNDLFLVRRHLARAGINHPVLAFANGEEVLAYLRASAAQADAKRDLRPRLLFLDIKMPRCDGFEVLRWIRRQDAWRDLTVVLLSGSDEPRDIARAKELGADRYLTKYPPPPTFAEIIAAAMARGEGASPA